MKHKKQYIRKEEVIDYNCKDYSKRRLLYNNLIDGLIKDGVLTENQFNNWNIPKFLDNGSK